MELHERLDVLDPGLGQQLRHGFPLFPLPWGEERSTGRGRTPNPPRDPGFQALAAAERMVTRPAASVERERENQPSPAHPGVDGAGWGCPSSRGRSALYRVEGLSVNALSETGSLH